MARRRFAAISPAMGSPFIKMNGLGNDFVIVAGEVAPSAVQVRAIANRDSGIGCDQFILLGPSQRGDVAMRIWNPDGSPAERCGNAERCVAWLTMKSGGRSDTVLENGDRLSYAKSSAAGDVTVDMGPPGLHWREIPLAWEMDTRQIQLRLDDHLKGPGCVSMGNPHVVFFVPDAQAAPVATTGPVVEKHWLFPERVNVDFAEVLNPSRIRLKVWERGAGLTRACGTGACAALVAAHRRGLAGRSATVVLDGGELEIQWRESDDHVLMTGPVGGGVHRTPARRGAAIMTGHPALQAGKTAVITGAADGVGLATARRLAAMGMNVVMADLEGARLDQAADLTRGEASGSVVEACATDVADRDAVLRLKTHAYDKFGRVDFLINNAGVSGGAQAHEHPERWDRVLAINLGGVINGVQAFTGAMIDQGGPAAIVNTGSKQGITMPPGDTAYNVSKAAIKALTEGLQHTLRETSGVRGQRRTC